eukprot:Gb_38522 [translate_table: standard]
MSTRYAVAVHRVKVAERSQDPTQQLSWAANEMASILREGDPATVKPHLAWAGLAMVDRAQHETAAAFEEGETDLKEVEERALYTLQQEINCVRSQPCRLFFGTQLSSVNMALPWMDKSKLWKTQSAPKLKSQCNKATYLGIHPGHDFKYWAYDAWPPCRTLKGFVF